MKKVLALPPIRITVIKAVRKTLKILRIFIISKMTFVDILIYKNFLKTLDRVEKKLKEGS